MAVRPRPLTLLEQAQSIANASLNPAKADVNAQIAAAQKDRIAALTAAEGITKALGSLSAGDATLARDTFAGASDRISAMSQGLTGSVRAAQEAGAQAPQNLISSLGLEGKVTSFAGDNANVSQFLANQPAEGLALEAARSLSNMLDRRFAGGVRIADAASSNDWKAGQDINGIRAQLKALEAKRPGIIQEAFSNLRGLQVNERQVANQELATRVQVGQLKLAQAKTAWEIAEAYTDITSTVWTVKNGKPVNTHVRAPGSAGEINAADNTTSAANNAATNAAANGRAAANRAATLERTQLQISGQNERARLGRVAAAKAAKEKASTGAVSPSTKNTVVSGANSIGQQAMDSYISRVWGKIPKTHPKGDKETDANYNARIANAQRIYAARLGKNYGTAMAQVMTAIAPQLKIIGYNKAQIRVFATRIVSAQITPPGTAPSVAGR